MAVATRSGRFDEYNYRCACIAQLVEQLTLKQRSVADSSGRPRTNLQLTQISWQGLPHIYKDVSLIATRLVKKRERLSGLGRIRTPMADTTVCAPLLAARTSACARRFRSRPPVGRFWARREGTHVTGGSGQAFKGAIIAPCGRRGWRLGAAGACYSTVARRPDNLCSAADRCSRLGGSDA